MNFFVNQTLGIGNSGIEHAQFYRAKRFDQVGLPYRFVFVELTKNLHEAMAHWGLATNQVINMWEYFVLGPDYAKNGLKSKISTRTMMLNDSTNTNRMAETITDSGMRIREYFIKLPNPKKPGMLLVSVDHVEIFNFETNQRMVSYDVPVGISHSTKVINIHLFNQPDGKHLFFENLVTLKRYFFKKLNHIFAEKNVFFIDRGQDNEVALLNASDQDWKTIDVIHADHLSNRVVPSAPLWNNHNEYLLTHLESVDRVVVATKLQREDLLVDFPNMMQKIVAIPVGGVRDSINKIHPHALTATLRLVTVSRLADEKHIDLVVRAVAELNQEGIPVTLDIYGQGSAIVKIKKAMKEGNAEDFITPMGENNHIEEVYPKYDAFISASYSEGFGLTYIEAMNAGLPIVTFKARFGAIELIKDNYNGFLQDFKRNDEAFNVAQLKLGIKRLLATSDYMKLQKNVVASVESYRDHVIAGEWRDLLNEL